MAISLRDIRFDSQTGRLARHIAASERLNSLLPQDKVNALLASIEAATTTLAAARELRPALPNIAATVEPEFRAGRAVDPAKLVREQAAAQAEYDQVQRVIDALANEPQRFVYELESLLTQSADAFVEGLDKQLQTLLDEAEEVLAAMPGVIDAETAITEGKVAEYTRWRELHQSYIALRSDHLELLRAADPAGNFASGRPAIGYAFYRSLDSALPTFIAALEDGGSTIDRLPFDVVTPSDPGHWRATVARRALLEPTVEYADEAVAAAGAAAERHRVAADSPQREPERLASLASSHPHMAQRSRNQGPVITPRVLQPFDQRRGA